MPALVLIERFSGFQLQVKHNASINRTWHTKSEGKNSEILEHGRYWKKKTRNPIAILPNIGNFAADYNTCAQ